MIRFIGVAVVLILAVGCSQLSTDQAGNTSSSTTPVAFNTAGAPTVQFSVPDMMCPEGCGVKVKEILSEQPGAKDVLVDFDSKTATVAIDKDKFDARQAVAALVDCQFKHSTLKNADAVGNGGSPQPPRAKSVQ